MSTALPLAFSSLPSKEGILLVDKEKGKTAFYLVTLLRKHTGIQKIGHAGILDPFATGVMVMLIGRSYTKIADSFIQDDKEYVGVLKLGTATDTYDCDGKITKESSLKPRREEIEKLLLSFQGEIEQIPPMFSAKKIKGKKLYLLARKGIEVERAPVNIRLQTEMLNYFYPYLTLKVSCSKGTYIRSIAHEIGEKLGTGAHLVELRRTKSGPFHIEECLSTSQLKDPHFSYLPYLRKSRCN